MGYSSWHMRSAGIQRTIAIADPSGLKSAACTFSISGLGAPLSPTVRARLPGERLFVMRWGASATANSPRVETANS